jgi:hypothetical protein
MDRITKQFLTEFIVQQDLNTLAESTAFEHFCGALLGSSHVGESVDSEDIAVGAGGDCGIDCIAVVANGSLITEPEEVRDLCDLNGYLDVSFIFVQSETSSGFDTQKIGQFAFGVRDFLSETPKLPQNPSVEKYAAITREVFAQSRFFRKGNPQCFLYYATTGKWVEETNLTVRRDGERGDIEALGIFRTVSFECIGADILQELYRKSQNSISCEVVLEKRVVIPKLPGVEQAFIGLLPATEFLKMIQSSTGEILSSLFYDNVRHWQEWNVVNNEIKATLENPTQKAFFPLLNNGITIVAQRVNPTGDRLLIEDYQVVNGCQSSFVLHACRSQLEDSSVMIPVRIIATRDEEVRNAIIKATNRQTEVTADQFFAISEFPKKLEAYFATFAGKQRLYYERRARQYTQDGTIERVRVINMTLLVRAFAAMFREAPHRTTRNYKALLKEVGDEIFGASHRLEPYYVSAFAHYRLDYLFRNGHVESKLKPARYHILLAARYIHNPAKLPRMNAHEMERFCEAFQKVLWSDEDAKELLTREVALIETLAAGDFSRDTIRTDPFTKKLLQYFSEKPGAGMNTAAEGN